MKKVIFIMVFQFNLGIGLSQSVAINSTGAPADPSSALDLQSTSKGFLVPRMTLSDRNSIASPAIGLLIYQTNSNPGFYYYNGSDWVQGIGATGATGSTGSIGLTGATGAPGPAGLLANGSAAGNTPYWNGSEWVVNNSNVFNNGGNVGIGTTSPAYKLTLPSGSTFGYGDGTATYSSRTETRNDAGLQGNAGAQSGFFQTSAPAPSANWPTGATNWWHLLDVRHSNDANNYSLQLAGSFFDQDLYFRKTNGAANTAWSKVAAGQKVTTASSAVNTRLNGNNTGTYANGAGRGWTIGTWQDVPGLSITRTVPTGKKVFVSTTIDGYGNDWGYWAPQVAVFRILRDGTQVGKTSIMSNESLYNYYYWNANLDINDFTGDGASHTWKVQYWLSNEIAGSTEAIFVEDRNITLMEISE
jgi:hypothetical protein